MRVNPHPLFWGGGFRTKKAEFQYLLLAAVLYCGSFYLLNEPENRKKLFTIKKNILIIKNMSVKNLWDIMAVFGIFSLCCSICVMAYALKIAMHDECDSNDEKAEELTDF